MAAHVIKWQGLKANPHSKCCLLNVLRPFVLMGTKLATLVDFREIITIIIIIIPFWAVWSKANYWSSIMYFKPIALPNF